MNRHLLIASSFTLFFAASASAQNSATATASAGATITTTVKSVPAATAPMQAAEDTSAGWTHVTGHRGMGNVIGGPGTGAPDAVNQERWAAQNWPDDESVANNPTWAKGHPMMAKAIKFLNNDSFRAKVETPMTSDDKQTIESTVADLKSHIATLKTFRPQFKAARESQDTVTMHQLAQNSYSHFSQIHTDRKIIEGILAKYNITPSTGATNATATSNALLDPVYPNPVHVGGAAATITYHVDQAGPVTIMVTDATGHTVQQFSENPDTPGAHTVTLNSNLPGSGTYYVTIQTATATSTQKVEAIQ